MELDLETLNLNQRRAVEWQSGPLLVLAGPGSGKTRVLTMRVAKLILESPGKRFRILGLTFTNKAAAEMRGRVHELIYDGQERVLLSTFHSFCSDILRQHGSMLGLRPDFTILNQDGDREGVLSDAIADLQANGSEVQDTDVRLLPIIDKLLENLVPEDAVASRMRNPELGEKVALLYRAYRQELLARNYTDYPSLLVCAHQLLSMHPAVAKQLRVIYPHVCVDEFQDTNHAQYQILRDIVGDSPKNLFVVADDDQVLYQWNGASPERLHQLRRDFGMQVIQLPTNYRCPPEVIRLANNLIKHNDSRSPDKEPLIAAKQEDDPEAVRLVNFPTTAQELAWVAADIKSRPRERWGDCVILGRTNKLLEEAVRVVNDSGEKVGLKAVLAIRKNEFQSIPLRYLHSMLRLANARADREFLRRTCKAFYGLEGLDIRVDYVVAASSVNGDFLRSWFEEALARRELEPGTRTFLERSRVVLAEKLDYLGFTRLAFGWFDEVAGRLTSQASEAFLDYAEEKDTWDELIKTTFEKYGSEDMTLQILLHEFDLCPKSPLVPPGAVRCMTIHGAKGMEFQHVYLIGLVEDLLPSFQSIKKGATSHEMQEERRNCFVAITRTQVDLTLTYSDQHLGWMKQPSRFLTEMGLSNASPAASTGSPGIRP
jgi:DNA helicase-2/ATP-dependent DNA helicase PcrA